MAWQHEILTRIYCRPVLRNEVLGDHLKVLFSFTFNEVISCSFADSFASLLCATRVSFTSKFDSYDVCMLDQLIGCLVFPVSRHRADHGAALHWNSPCELGLEALAMYVYMDLVV